MNSNLLIGESNPWVFVFNISRCWFLIIFFFSGYNLIVLVLHSVQSSFSVVSDSFWPHGQQQARPLCPSPTPRACSNSCPSSQWCHPTISSSVIPSLPAFNLSQHQGLFQWVNSLHLVAKVLELQLHHQLSQWIFEIDFLRDWLVWSSCSPRDSQESFLTPQFKSINSFALRLLCGPTLTSIHDYWKNHSLD